MRTGGKQGVRRQREKEREENINKVDERYIFGSFLVISHLYLQSWETGCEGEKPEGRESKGGNEYIYEGRRQTVRRDPFSFTS